jgi:hypothetical protein
MRLADPDAIEYREATVEVRAGLRVPTQKDLAQAVVGTIEGPAARIDHCELREQADSTSEVIGIPGQPLNGPQQARMRGAAEQAPLGIRE